MFFYFEKNRWSAYQHEKFWIYQLKFLPRNFISYLEKNDVFNCWKLLGSFICRYPIWYAFLTFIFTIQKVTSSVIISVWIYLYSNILAHHLISAEVTFHISLISKQRGCSMAPPVVTTSKGRFFTQFSLQNEKKHWLQVDIIYLWI